MFIHLQDEIFLRTVVNRIGLRDEVVVEKIRWTSPKRTRSLRYPLVNVNRVT